MLTSFATLAGPVIDFGQVPWTAVTIGVGLALILIEARLIKSGFVKQGALDSLSGKVEHCIRIDAVDGLAKRIDDRFSAIDRERDALKSMTIMNRDDLDGARDRVTRLEGQHVALSERIMDRLNTLAELNPKLDRALLAIERHESDIANLKRGNHS